MIMKYKYILLILGLVLMSCERRSANVDFSWSPKEPKAGQSISFSNASTTGEEWSWNFGDLSTSSSKSPNKVYRRPGEYVVTLKVDNKSWLTATKTIRVYDTIPSFTCAPDSIDSIGRIRLYEPVVFKASVYNPYSHTLQYQWSLPEMEDGKQYIHLSDSTKENLFSVFFTTLVDSQAVSLTIHDKTSDSVYTCIRRFHIADVAARGLVVRDGGRILRQRIFGSPAKYFFEPEYASTYLKDDEALIHEAESRPENEWTADRRTYYVGEDGLYVRDLQGTNIVQIWSGKTFFVTGDRLLNRLFWSTDEGTYCLPLIQTDNNAFDRDKIYKINDLTSVDVIAVDNTKRTH